MISKKYKLVVFGRTFYSLSTFYCAGTWLFTASLSHPLLEFHSTYSEHFLLFFGQLTTGRKDGDQVQHNSEHHGNHLHVEEGKDEQ